MFNELKHDLNLSINDLQHELGLISDVEYFFANLQEDAYFYWNEFKVFVVEAKDDIIKTIGNSFNDLN